MKKRGYDEADLFSEFMVNIRSSIHHCWVRPPRLGRAYSHFHLDSYPFRACHHDHHDSHQHRDEYFYLHADEYRHPNDDENIDQHTHSHSDRNVCLSDLHGSPHWHLSNLHAQSNGFTDAQSHNNHHLRHTDLYLYANLYSFDRDVHGYPYDQSYHHFHLRFPDSHLLANRYLHGGPYHSGDHHL